MIKKWRHVYANFEGRSKIFKRVKPQLTRVGSVVIDLAGVDQDRVGVKKLMALKKKIRPFSNKVKR